MSVDLLAAVIGLVAGVIAMFPARRPAGSGRSDLGTLSVIIPARNEAGNVGPAVVSVRRALGDDVEIIVADDHSTDETAVEAAESGATVVQVGELPLGWSGKSYACWIGQQHSHRSNLMFLDADVRLGPDSKKYVMSGVSVIGETPNIVMSIQPWHVPVQFLEHLAMLFNIVSVMASRCRGMWATHHALTFGPLVMCDAHEYRSRGGHAHESVRGSVVEDIALGKLFDRTIVEVGTPDAVTFRMYDAGIHGVFGGFVKNVASAGSSVTALAWAGVTLWFVFLSAPVIVSPVLYPMCVAQVYVTSRAVGRFTLLDALMYPVHVAFFLLVLITSLWRKVVVRSVMWKGRSVDL